MGQYLQKATESRRMSLLFFLLKMDKFMYYRERAIRKRVETLMQPTKTKNLLPAKHYFRGTEQKRMDLVPKFIVMVMSFPAQRYPYRQSYNE